MPEHPRVRVQLSEPRPLALRTRSVVPVASWSGDRYRKTRSASHELAGPSQAAASELCRSGHQLEFLGSILVYSDETAFFLFEGAEEDVRAASERADVPSSVCSSRCKFDCPLK
jgi:hypothetical protein